MGDPPWAIPWGILQLVASTLLGPPLHQLGNPFLDLYKDADGLVTKKSGAQNNERFAHILDVTDTFDTHMGSSQKSGNDDQAKEDAKNQRIEAMQEQRARDSGM